MCGGRQELSRLQRRNHRGFPPSISSGTRIAALLFTAGLAVSLTACSTETPQTSEAHSSGKAAKVTPPTVIKADKLTVCTGDTPPNIFYDENNELQGVEIDIAHSLAKGLGLTAAFEEYAFSGLIPALQAKQCDVIMGSLYIKPEREEIANFVPYLYSGTGAGVSKANPKKITGFDDSLCGTNVIGITGATGGAATEELSKGCAAAGKKTIEITLVDESTSAVQQVIAGQADAFVDTSEIMAFYEKESEGAFKMIGEPSGKIRIGAATLKANTDLNKALDEAFATTVDDGSYASILKKWNMEANDITSAE
ncbi:ABC transporter substrate-binding protein [Leucobacter coleopterorum]|uniref:ABC transporter substrate-binding protein n=1 Tax=Leucobacter coleopterorum TaxID=2714933 RepID=A0ABX6JU88_9MICO|nr:ABC transporter substrate-binding protein [Leucobacter coleopterorum]QIM17862.1 ABC transporter substrate-binding protein [Leucobacter coleopterorum]